MLSPVLNLCRSPGCKTSHPPSPPPEYAEPKMLCVCVCEIDSCNGIQYHHLTFSLSHTLSLSPSSTPYSHHLSKIVFFAFQTNLQILHRPHLSSHLLCSSCIISKYSGSKSLIPLYFYFIYFLAFFESKYLIANYIISITI